MILIHAAVGVIPVRLRMVRPVPEPSRRFAPTSLCKGGEERGCAALLPPLKKGGLGRVQNLRDMIRIGGGRDPEPSRRFAPTSLCKGGEESGSAARQCGRARCASSPLASAPSVARQNAARTKPTTRRNWPPAVFPIPDRNPRDRRACPFAVRFSNAASRFPGGGRQKKEPRRAIARRRPPLAP